MKKYIVILLLLAVLVFSQPAQATGVPSWYNSDKFEPIQYQAWDTIDATRLSPISEGVTVLVGEDFLTTPGTLLRISGRCFLEYPSVAFNARLAVWYDANVIPTNHALAFTNDRTVTFVYTFVAGQRLQLQLYTDGVTASNRVRCNVAFEVVD